MEPTTPISPERLLEHHEWMEALARRLLRGASGADDLVQDVYLSALERPPRPSGKLRSWLGGALRNRARERRREQARRAQREQSVARKPEDDSPIGRLSVHQDVVRAVLELREPYRTAVLLRFYYGLTPRAIAARTHTPVNTVKSRVARGLELLRSRLQAEYGEQGRSWTNALVPLLPAKTLASTVLGAVAAKTSTQVAAAAAVSIATVAFVGYQIAALSPAMERPEPRGSVQGGLEAAVVDADATEQGEAQGATQDQRRVVPVNAPVATPAVASAPTRFPLEVEFELPNRSKPKLPSVSATLVLASGEELYAEAQDAKSVFFEEIPAGRHELTVFGAPHRHEAEWIDCDTDSLQNRQGGGQQFQHRATLWPEDWIPLVVRTRDGRPFTSLATDLGYEPKRFFVSAFHVAVGLEPFAPGTAFPGDSEYGTFRPPPGYQNVEIGGSIAGAIQLLQAPPLWAGLWIHGVFFGNRMLDANDDELVFEIEQSDLDARFATVKLRVVDAGSGVPVSDVQATIKANTSAHRRHDLQQQIPSPAGEVVFQRVIPGKHELSVWREGGTAQRRLDVAPGQELDLGDIPIRSGPGIQLDIVGTDGKPCRAWIELAPYEAGRSVDELYHPNLHRSANDQGEYVLPVPEGLSIVRARTFSSHPERRQGGRPGYFYGSTPEVDTANILIDPDHAPLELRIQARALVEITFEPLAPWVPSHRLTIHDELDLIVAEITDRSADALRADLIEGRYLVRRWDGDVELGATDIVVRKDSERMPAP